MRLRTARYLIPLLLSGVGLTSLSAMAASLTPLAPVINGSTHVNAVSGDGQTAGGSSTNSVGNPGPAAWGHGASPIITGTWLYNSSFAGQTYAVSNDGSSYAIFLSGFNDARVVRGGAGHWLYGPDGSANGVQTAFGLSGDGDIVVGRHGGSAAYWTYLGPANGYANAALMPTLSGNSTAYALGLDGTVAVGTSLDANATQRAVVWTGTAFGTVSSLDPTELYGPSAASAISDDASTIVGYVTDGGNQTAAIWNGTAYGTVGLVGPIGSSTSRAMAVNADGSIVGGTFELQSSAGTYHAFLKSGSAPSADLNDLLTTAGVNMTGIVLADVTGLSDTGHYLAANDTMAGQAYIVFYDGTIAGVSSGAAQVESLTQLGDQRSALLTQPGSYESVLLGDLDAGNNGGSELSAFGLYGSAAFGIKGRTSVGDLTVNAGVMLGTGDYGSVAYDGGLAAASLRYDLSTGDPGLTPFLEAGGSFGLLQNLTFRRSYANGAGTASGIGTTDGYIASTFARLGLDAQLSADDRVTLAAEIGQHWLTTSAYGEVQSATNPFPGSFSAATDTATTVEAAAGWTHQVAETVDLSLRGAVGMSLAGSSSLVATAAGVGDVAVAPASGLYAEAGLRLGWQATDSTRLDLYATGTAGEHVGTAGHIGGGLSVGF